MAQQAQRGLFVVEYIQSSQVEGMTMTETSVDTALDAALDTAIAQIIADISKVKENGGNALNEAMTEAIVIDKLLSVLGYGFWDYQKQGATASIGNIPDYTVLPGHNRQWYLEVKRWQLPLKEVEASQAVNYAFNQGKRWAVLTNGDEWRVYDAFSKAPLEDKCTRFAKTLTEAKSLLKLLAKDAMLRGEIEKIHHHENVLNAVRAEIGNENSETVKILRRCVGKCLDITVTKQEIMEALAAVCISSGVQTVPVALPVVPLIPQPTIVAKQINSDSLTRQRLFFLTDFAAKNPAPASLNIRSLRLALEDGEPVLMKNWRYLVRAVVVWTIEKYGMPVMPYVPADPAHGYRCFLNYEMKHPQGEPGTQWDEIIVNGQKLFVNEKYSAESFCKYLVKLINDLHGDPSLVKIEVEVLAGE